MSSLSLCATDAYVIRADGSGRTRLTDSPRFHEGEPPDLANNPVFAPNGTQIMYSHFLPNTMCLPDPSVFMATRTILHQSTARSEQGRLGHASLLTVIARGRD